MLLLPAQIDKIELSNMGRGDKKTAKGKRTIGSYGVSRNKAAIKTRIKRNASKKAAGEGSAEAPAKAAKRTTKKKADA